MSGTSLDGIDAVLVDFGQPRNRLIQDFYLPYGEDLRNRLLALHQPGENELHRAACLGNELARCYAAAVGGLLEGGKVKPVEIHAIGCHGQTVRHRPDQGYTVQLGNPALLAELTGISVVADFRSSDIAAGGQGAPLVPAFHEAVFRDKTVHRVIVNIGGICNLTNLPPDGDVTGFDCGPGNLLLDAWTRLHLNKLYDENGAWAESGKVIPELLRGMLAHDFFQQPPPKSTGREMFHLPWLKGILSGSEAPADVQATLLRLTVECIGKAIADYCAGAEEIYLCGGGARNQALVKNLRGAVTGVKIELTDALGVKAEWVEGFAFAWLARQALSSKSGNLPAVTGAQGKRVLGAIYQA